MVTYPIGSKTLAISDKMILLDNRSEIGSIIYRKVLIARNGAVHTRRFEGDCQQAEIVDWLFVIGKLWSKRPNLWDTTNINKNVR